MGDMSQTQPLLAMGADASKKPKGEDKQTCLPVTIRSIEAAAARSSGDAEIAFFGTEPGMLLVIDVVESVSQQAASIEFSVNDSTGRIRIRQFGVESDSPLSTVEPGKYIAVAGQLRTSPELHMTVANARIVRAADEISYHMIEAAHAALKLQRGDVDPVMSPSKPQKVVADVSMTQGPATIATSMTAAPVAASPTVRPVKDVVIEFLQKEGAAKPQGVEFSSVCAHVKTSPESELRTILQQLVDDGDAYTTLDDDHFALI